MMSVVESRYTYSTSIHLQGLHRPQRDQRHLQMSCPLMLTLKCIMRHNDKHCHLRLCLCPTLWHQLRDRHLSIDHHARLTLLPLQFTRPLLSSHVQVRIKVVKEMLVRAQNHAPALPTQAWPPFRNTSYTAGAQVCANEV